MQAYALRELWQCWLAAGYVWSGGDYGVVENLHMHMMLTTWLMGCTYSVHLYMLESLLKPKTLWWKKNLLTFVYQS